MANGTDVVIHIDETLDSENRKKLSNEVCHIDGVLSADLKKKQPHLMIVSYNPVKMKSIDVLAGVKSSGMHAQLVGWL